MSTLFRTLTLLFSSSSKIWWLLLPSALTALAFADRRLAWTIFAAAVFALRALVELVEVSARLRRPQEQS